MLTLRRKVKLSLLPFPGEMYTLVALIKPWKYYLVIKPGICDWTNTNSVQFEQIDRGKNIA